MPKVPYLVKRGHVFWWRRRRPLFTLPQPSPGTDEASTAAGDSKVGGPGHFALSLRTPCPREAGRRVAALNLLFEEQRRRIEAAMAGEDGMSDQHFVERAMADMAAALRAQAEMLARQMSPTGPAVVAALPQEPSPPPISDAPPPPHPYAASSTPGRNRIDDPEFERAVLEMAEREGWWHEDPEDIVDQFDMMLTGLFTLQEGFVAQTSRGFMS